MILKVFSVFDCKASAYMQPFFMASVGEAIRSWQEVSNDGKSTISKYPGDFTLFEIGSYDDQTGSFSMKQSYVNLGTALSHKVPHAEQLPMFKSVPTSSAQIESGVQ